jgi:plastocyanin
LRQEPILLDVHAGGDEGVFMRTISVPALIAGALIAIACGGDSNSPSTGPSSAPPSSGSSTPTIVINRQNGSLSFSPNPAAFGGQSVVFRNADSVVHRVQLNDMSVDTGDIAPGVTSRAVVMPTGGTNYHCALHPDMVGAINASGGAPPPPCEGIYCGTAR